MKGCTRKSLRETGSFSDCHSGVCHYKSYLVIHNPYTRSRFCVPDRRDQLLEQVLYGLSRGERLRSICIELFALVDRLP